jgi:hypothetical protein
MSNDELIELAKEAGAIPIYKYINRDITKEVTHYIINPDRLAKFASLIEAKHSARTAELEAQLARYEVIGEVTPLKMVEWNQPFAGSCEVGTKLFALKDEK